MFRSYRGPANSYRFTDSIVVIDFSPRAQAPGNSARGLQTQRLWIAEKSRKSNAELKQREKKTPAQPCPRALGAKALHKLFPWQRKDHMWWMSAMSFNTALEGVHVARRGERRKADAEQRRK